MAPEIRVAQKDKNFLSRIALEVLGEQYDQHSGVFIHAGIDGGTEFIQVNQQIIHRGKSRKGGESKL